ncbi:hypothetical protein SYNPS1DRAFT_27995 [Syncephalis pseudoplumigaleata]|uniref:F-box domain-containing protein n=1 Tax=Syncephalis pseudoplumigaleata TaxID=1712513 RepID=A0A4P9Z2W6_9FUNG|nr:hypothetical protein SYNPS1DRAFT_27995 [Syncephalis pseudoplumigaleata]|eukprot:RKP26312.1 hypothetical protein SYNPS1DRAFT_27995 [Syncephalis pseudoplumigaleata]
MTVSNRPCNLLVLLNTLPFTNFWRFLFYLDGITVARLSSCCRALRHRICADASLWKRLYHAHFLAGPHAAKELDFLYWCARDHVLGNGLPTDAAHQLASLNWYDLYRRRVCIERNWRHGNATRSLLSLPPMADVDGWVVSYSCSTAVLLSGSLSTGSSPAKHIVSLECSPSSSSSPASSSPSSSSPNTSHSRSLSASYAVSAAPPAPVIALATVKQQQQQQSSPHGNTIAAGPTQTIMSDRFVVTLSACFMERKARLEVRDRRTFQLKHVRQLPYKSMLRSIAGQWALLSCTERQADDTETRQLIVLNLERQTKHVKRVRTEWASMCLQQTSSDSAVVYTTRLDTVNYEGIDWATYKFTSAGLARRLQRGHVTIDDGEAIEYLCAHPLDASRVLLETRSGDDNRQLLVHTVAASAVTDLAADMEEVAEEQVAALLLQHGIDYQTGDRLFVERHDEAMLHYCRRQRSHHSRQRVHWPNAVKIQHLIGNLCIMHEWQNDASIRVVLVDIGSGQTIRTLGPYNAYNASTYLATSAMMVDNQCNKVDIIDYSVVL